MRMYSEIHAELEHLYNEFYNHRRTINLEILEYIYNKIQKNFEVYEFDHIEINVIDYDDDYSTIDVSINGYHHENYEELDYELEMEKLIKYVVIDRLDDIDQELTVTRETDLISFQHAYGY